MQASLYQLPPTSVLQIFEQGCASVKSEDQDDVVEYIAMEYIPGGTLRATMSAEGFHPEEERTREWLVNYFLPLLDGVQALHEAGIVQRDLKPENVLLDGNVPKITDFGLARSSKLKPITQSIETKGTPPYMSPEHFLDLKRTDERTDVYALGKMLFEAIAGKMGSEQIPFRKATLENPATTFYLKLDGIIQEATAEEKKQRLPSVRALKEALEKVLGEVEKAPAPLNVQATERAKSWKLPARALVLIVALFGAIDLGTVLVQKNPPATSPPTHDAGSKSMIGYHVKETAGAPRLLECLRSIPALCRFVRTVRGRTYYEQHSRTFTVQRSGRPFRGLTGP